MTGLTCHELVVDCGEGTLRQFALQPSRPNQRTLKASRITKIFITHMHGEGTRSSLALFN